MMKMNNPETHSALTRRFSLLNTEMISQVLFWMQFKMTTTEICLVAMHRQNLIIIS